METEEYKPKQGELIWVWDSDEDQKQLRVFKRFNDYKPEEGDKDVYCYACISGNIYDGEPLSNSETWWSNYARHEGKFHDNFKPQNTLLNFNHY